MCSPSSVSAARRHGPARFVRSGFPRSAPALITGLTIAAAACQHENPYRGDLQDAPVYAFQQQDSRETLKQALVARQRDMFDVAIHGPGTALAEYLDYRFTWNARGSSPPGSGPLATHGYFAALAGRHPALLKQVPSAYLVLLNSDSSAQVYAALPDDTGGIITSWQFHDGEWRALRSDVLDVGIEEWEAGLNRIEQARSAARRASR